MKTVSKDFTVSGIGNRLTSTSPVLGDHTYTPNALNQYATITTGNTRTAVGRAPGDWTVLVDGITANRIGEVFYRPLTATNATAPVWQDVVIQRDTGTPSMTQDFWYAPQSFAPTYDDDGNLTNGGRWTYLWNAEQCDRLGSILDGGEAGARRVHLPMPRQMNQNRLIEMEAIIDPVTKIPPAGNPYTKLQFVYDWQGRRIARHVWQGGTQASPSFKSSRRWLYDGWNVITEFSAPSATSTTLTRFNIFTWGLDLSGTLQGAGGVGGLLVQTSFTDSNIGIQRASYDGNGNIVAWTKSDASAPTSRREYDAFGNTLVSEGVSPSTFGFSTKMQDVDTGLYYYGYRFYDPVMGRWPSRDPMEEEGGSNLRAFLANDGLNQWDAFGLSAGEPYNTYAEARAAAIEDLRKAGWDSWNRGKAALNKFKNWSKLPPQRHADWAVYQNPGMGELSKYIVAGAEQFTIHYCKDDLHYYMDIQAGEVPTEEEVRDRKGGGMDGDDFAEQVASIPEGGRLEGVGHTHIFQWFFTNYKGELKVLDRDYGLSEGDKKAAQGLKVEVYVVEFDNSVHP